MSSVGGDLSSNQTRIAVPVHADAMMSSKGQDVIVLQNASPFLSCTLAAAPSTSARDLSTAFSAFIAAVGTVQLPASAFEVANPLTDILARARQLAGAENTLNMNFQPLPAMIAQTFKDNWRYSFSTPNNAAAVTSLNNALGLLTTPKAIVAGFQIGLVALFETNRVENAQSTLMLDCLAVRPGSRGSGVLGSFS